MAELSDENLKLAKRVLELEKALKASQIQVASLSAGPGCTGEADDIASDDYTYKGVGMASSVVQARGSSSATTTQDGGGSGSYSHTSDDR